MPRRMIILGGLQEGFILRWEFQVTVRGSTLVEKNRRAVTARVFGVLQEDTRDFLFRDRH
jgi:hypothetical protein